MDFWLEKAAEFLPDLEDLITQERPMRGPMSLWIDLHYELVKAYDVSPPNEKLIGGIYDFAAWCLQQPPTSDASSDLSTAVAVALIEHLPLDRRISDDLHRWMSLESFKGFENLFRYHLSDEEYNKFAKDFISRKKRSDIPPRI